MHSNQSWPPVISPSGVHPCFRNDTRAKQGCYRVCQGHTDMTCITDNALNWSFQVHSPSLVRFFQSRIEVLSKNIRKI
jgi:hypothetical protein